MRGLDGRQGREAVGPAAATRPWQLAISWVLCTYEAQGKTEAVVGSGWVISKLMHLVINAVVTSPLNDADLQMQLGNPNNAGISSIRPFSNLSQ